jgi:thiamine biosynthesis lipoprotein
MVPRRRSTRRQFLKGEAALDALQQVPFDTVAPETEQARPRDPADEPPSDQPAGVIVPRPARRGSPLLMQIGRRAMACEFQVFCDPERYVGAVEAATAALDLVDRLEAQMTVYRAHSELMEINRRAAYEASPVERQLFALLERCTRWSAETGGAFDITAGPLVKLWGFYKRRGRFPERAEVERVLESIGSAHLDLDPERLTVRFRRPEMELNLGSVGKGYALDRCADLLVEAGVESFLLHGGQSSILARGAKRVGQLADVDDSQPDAPWSVALRHPLRRDQRLAQLTLRDRAVGTSGSGQQFFYHRGRRYGHVLDPRTGFPAEHVLSATVIAPSAAEADALATTFFVMGVEATSAYCAQHPELTVVFVLPGNRQGTAAIEVVGPADCVELLSA